MQKNIFDRVVNVNENRKGALDVSDYTILAGRAFQTCRALYLVTKAINDPFTLATHTMVVVSDACKMYEVYYKETGVVLGLCNAAAHLSHSGYLAYNIKQIGKIDAKISALESQLGESATKQLPNMVEDEIIGKFRAEGEGIKASLTRSDTMMKLSVATHMLETAATITKECFEESCSEHYTTLGIGIASNVFVAIIHHVYVRSNVDNPVINHGTSVFLGVVSGIISGFATTWVGASDVSQDVAENSQGTDNIYDRFIALFVEKETEDPNIDKSSIHVTHTLLE